MCCCCCSVTKSCLTLCDPMDYIACQSPLSSTISQSLLKLMSIKSVMPSNHLILYHPSPSPFTFNLSQYQGLFKCNHHRCHRRRPSRAGQTCSRRDLPWACSPARIWADPSSCSRSCLQTPRSPTLPLTALGRSCRPGVQGAGSGTGGLLSGDQAPPSLGFSRQEQWSGLPFPSPMHESEK